MKSRSQNKAAGKKKRRKRQLSPLPGPIAREELQPPSDPSFRFRFAVYGDSQRGVKIHRRIAECILLSGAEVVLHVGDYVQNGREDEQWEEQLCRPARTLLEQLTFFGVLGNHDKNSAKYYQIVDPPGGCSWFQAVRQPAAFFGIDTNTNLSVSGPQGRWLKEALKECGENWKIVFLHEAPYSSSWPWPGGAIKTRKHVMPVLEKFGVDLVFAGHIHNYERFHKDGIPYFITGGGGDRLSKPEQLKNPYKEWTAQLHHFCTADVYSDRIRVLARDTRGVPFDGLDISKKGKFEEVKVENRRGYTGRRPKKFPKLRYHLK